MGLFDSATVEIQTAFSPSVKVKPFDGSGGGKPSPLLQLLRPKIIAYDGNGNNLFSTAPYGEPGDPTPGIVVLVGVVVAFLSVIFLAGRASK